ncbi:MAG TPA: VanZ family protein [Planctomycetota bacterium]|nr:VanZ family protein [Planctomycetota bacterium]
MRWSPRTVRWCFGGAALLYALGIAYLSSRTRGQLQTPFSGSSLSLLHVPLHGVLALLVLRTLVPLGDGNRSWPGCFTWSGAIVLAVILLHGMVDEVHQHFVPGRTCSLFDACLDACGALMVLLAPWPRGPGRPANLFPLLFVGILAALLAYVLPDWFPGVDGAIEGWIASAGT